MMRRSEATPAHNPPYRRLAAITGLSAIAAPQPYAPAQRNRETGDRGNRNCQQGRVMDSVARELLLHGARWDPQDKNGNCYSRVGMGPARSRGKLMGPRVGWAPEKTRRDLWAEEKLAPTPAT